MDHGNLRGVGIQKIEQISSSTDSLGANVIRVTLDDGSFYDYTVRNGDRGPAGSLWIGTSEPPDDSYSIWLNPSGMVSGYVGTNQGAENAGRVLAVGEDGVVIPREETPYTLPEASPDALGGVKADAAETADTQPVRKGTDGKLYTAPGVGTSIGITGASAGQIPKVKAVDESGAPTEWKAEKDTTPFIVTVGVTASSGYTSSHTFDEIAAAASAGRVVMAYTDYINFPQVGQSLYGVYFNLDSTQDVAIFVYIDAWNMIKYTFAVDPFSISASASYLSATSSTFGGVKADSAESTDTQPVRIGGDGKLYTAPGGGGGADISLGISGATAGKVAKVKAVDASGVPTEWEAGDAAGGYSGYGNRNPDYTYTVTEVISELYISEINGNTFSANKLACLVEFPAGTGGLYYHALYTLQGSKDKNYCISNHNPPKLSNISTKDSAVFFIVEKLNNQNYKYNYSGQCKKREQLLDGSYGTYAAGIFPNSIEGETSIKSILLKGENAFGVGVKISIWLN